MKNRRHEKEPNNILIQYQLVLYTDSRVEHIMFVPLGWHSKLDKIPKIFCSLLLQLKLLNTQYVMSNCVSNSGPVIWSTNRPKYIKHV